LAQARESFTEAADGGNARAVIVAVSPNEVSQAMCGVLFSPALVASVTYLRIKLSSPHIKYDTWGCIRNSSCSISQRIDVFNTRPR